MSINNIDTDKIFIIACAVVIMTITLSASSCEYAVKREMARNGYEQAILPGSSEAKWQKVRP